jgi:sn-glycerol 3-phosphate transport system substrate-binding protein
MLIHRLPIARLAVVLIATAGFAGATPARAAVEIQWWHAMGGELGEKLEKLATDFNAVQSDFKVIPVFKGSYPEAMTGAIAAFRARQHPAMLQVFEVGTATMMAAKGAVYPAYQLMKDQSEPFDPKSYLPAVAGYYTDRVGNMLSVPFNSSTPILYYNKDAFRKAGLDPGAPPRTWPEVEAAGKKLQAAGLSCGITTEWPSWVLVENLSAYHNVALSTKANGFEGLDTELKIDGPVVTRQIATLTEWQKTKLYDYGGRTNKAVPKFVAGECGIFIGSSATRAAVLATAKFEVGYGMQPYWPDVKGAPQNSIIGGASLWVLKGRPDAEYKGVAKFFTFLSRAETQAWWHQNTGYLPITHAAYELTRAQGYYDRNLGTDTAIRQITLNPPTENSKGLRLGSFAQIRDVVEEELEQAFAGKKPAKIALESAVKRGNDLLRQFERANK